MTHQNIRYQLKNFITSFSVINYSGEGEDKHGEIFREKYGKLINEIEIYKQPLNEEEKVPPSSSENRQVIWELTIYKNTRIR